MKTMINTKMIKVAAEAALTSGRALIKAYEKFNRSEVKFKASREIITKADFLSERIIKRIIKTSFPDHQILAEESGYSSKKSPYLWIIDPVDGTTNFSMHNPLWAISIALCYQGEVQLGLVLAPVLGEVFLAVKGLGAFLNGQPIRVSDKRLKEAISTFCHGRETKYVKRALKYYEKQKLSYFDCRQMGSASLELAYTAAGRIESIGIPGARAWDVAAGALIVSEAKGKVTDLEGQKWNVKSQGILASNNKDHGQLVKLWR